MNNVCVHGLGYIGLPTALLLANSGFNVVGVDINENVVNSVNMAQLHIVENGLDNLLITAVENKTLFAQNSPTKADIHIICVPTPCIMSSPEVKSDLRYVEAAMSKIAPVYRQSDLIVLESTVPVGATEQLEQTFRKQRSDIENLQIVYCPERVLPGNLLYELKNNDRVIGGNSKITLERAKSFYETFVSGEIYITDYRTAELSKLVENSYRDVNIAFANELSLICEQAGIDVYQLIELVNKHPRVNVLQPGIGVGGHCIAVDPWFIVEHDRNNSQLIKLARERNLYKTKHILEKIFKHVREYEAENGRQPRIGCLGLSYKPDIDDLRESPAVSIVRELNAHYEFVYVSDPNIVNSAEFRMLSVAETLAECDLVFGLVAHKEFKQIANAGKIDQVIFVDFCGIEKNIKLVL